MSGRDALRVIVERAAFVSASQFVVNDRAYDVPAAAGASDEHACARLEDVLYRQLYTCPSQPGQAIAPTLLQEFVARLSAANAGTGTYEAGWVVRQLEPDGSIAVEKDGLTVWALPHEFIPDAGGVEVGRGGWLRIGKEQRHLTPGFYFAFGDALPRGRDTQAVVRIYWHVTAAGAPPLVRAITRELNARGVPFHFKTLADPQQYCRADAAVLYMPKPAYADARQPLIRVVGLVKPWLRPEVPLMTKALAAGVGLAEDPGDVESSFGQHRCRLVARSLWRSFEAGRTAADERLADARAYFAQHGLDPRRLYLQPGSRDCYAPLARGSARAHRRIAR